MKFLIDNQKVQNFERKSLSLQEGELNAILELNLPTNFIVAMFLNISSSWSRGIAERWRRRTCAGKPMILLGFSS